MKHDFLAHLEDLPVRHSGLLFEQMHTASLGVAFLMRGLGLKLPGGEYVPSQSDVFTHLSGLVNEALESYNEVQKQAPEQTKPNEIWGSAEDDAFAVEVTGRSQNPEDGFEISVQFDMLFRS